nr:hypothetical protein Iba_chr08cCG5550 [Ipomoea batatas]
MAFKVLWANSYSIPERSIELAAHAGPQRAPHTLYPPVAMTSGVRISRNFHLDGTMDAITYQVPHGLSVFKFYVEKKCAMANAIGGSLLMRHVVQPRGKCREIVQIAKLVGSIPNSWIDWSQKKVALMAIEIAAILRQEDGIIGSASREKETVPDD